MKKQTKVPKHIGIIGAGAAGLMAARELKKAGHEVIIYEARDRLGGRIHTHHEMASYPIELGAEYIHGDKAFTWTMLDEETKHNMRPTFMDDQAFAVFKDDQMIYYPQSDLLDGWQQLERLESLRFKPPKDKPLMSVLTPPVERWVNHMIASDYGADLDQLGLKGYIEASYEGEGEGDYRFDKGYDQLIQQLSQGLSVHLNHMVTRVDYSPKGVKLTFENQEPVHVDALVVTLPLGVLKANDVVFNPALPAPFQEAIKRIGSASVNKIILQFKEAFWPESLEWFVTDKDTQLWWRPGYKRNPEVPILTALVGGKHGESFSNMTEEDVIHEALQDLKDMFPDRPVNTYFDKGFFINWGADPFSKMGYSYNAVGSAAQRQNLTPVISGKIVFAGEATNALYPATVHGALLSAKRAAKRLLKHL